MALLLSLKRTVDLEPGLNAPQVFHVSQNDVGTRLYVGLEQGGTAYTIPDGTTAKVQGCNALGEPFEAITATVSASEVYFTITDQNVTQFAGNAKCEVVLTNGTNILGTANFIVAVEASPMGSDVPAIYTNPVQAYIEGVVQDYVDDDVLPDVTAAINSKVNIAQGSENAGKALVVNSSGNVEPGDIAIDIDNTLTQQGEAADAKATGDALALKANASTIAPEFSDQNNYTAGSYVYKNGVLYRFTADHAAGAWTGTDAETVTVGGEVESVKSTVNKIQTGRFTLASSNIIQGTYNSSGAVIANNSRIRNDGFLPVSNGQVLKFKPGTVTTQFIFGMYNTSKTYLGEIGFVSSESEIRLPFDGYIIVAFANATKTAIVPSDFDAVLSIVEKWDSADSDIKKELGNEINDKLPVLGKESTNGTIITEKQLDFDCVGALSDNNGMFRPEQTAYRTTDYIPLKNITGIYRTGTTTKFALWTYCFYDAEKQLLGLKATTTDYTIETYHGISVTWLDIDDYPTAEYIRITLQPSRPYTYYAVNSQPEYIYSIPQIRINGVNPLSGLKFAGKKIVNFGDSLFGNFRDTNTTTDKSISKMIAEATGATVYNCGFGGCRMAYHSEYWRAFSMYALADAIATDTWTDQDAAIAAQVTGMPEYFSETLATLKSIDFDNIDYITIGYGTNDYAGNVFINSTDGSFSEPYYYFKGAIEYSINKILTAFPHIRIIFITPCWRWFLENNIYAYSSDDSNSVNTRGYYLYDYVDAIKEVCKKNHVAYIDTYYTLGFNEYTHLEYFPAADGTHPNQNGRQLRADRIVGGMTSLY